MRLGLSSAAAPDARLDDLLAACSRRGLTALELRSGHDHGVGGAPGALSGDQARERVRTAQVCLSGLRSESAHDDAALGAVARAAGAPLLVAGGASIGARVERAIDAAARGTEAGIVVGGLESDGDLALAASSGFRVAWDADATHEDLRGLTRRVLEAARGRIHQITLLGGGPEAAMQEGRGIGELMGRLALAGYAGAVILAPSSPRYRVAWETWLGRRGGWGCGGTSADPSLVDLSGGIQSAGAGR